MARQLLYQGSASHDTGEGAYAPPDDAGFFDTFQLPIVSRNRAVWMEDGLAAGPHIWQSTGARYGELRVTMKRFGNLEVRPARGGSVRVAPSQ